MKRALVTGGCGFIGSNLTKELIKQGWQVDVVDDMSNGHLELLDGIDIRVIPNASFIGAYLKSYEDKYKNEIEIKDLEKINLEKNEYIFHAGTIEKQNKIFSNGGRVLNFVIRSKDLKANRNKIIQLINR